jgi:hypothetical protein
MPADQPAHLTDRQADVAAQLADITTARKLGAAQLADQDVQWRAAIRLALAEGVPTRTIATAAGGISFGRVYQIRDGRRGGTPRPPPPEGTP